MVKFMLEFFEVPYIPVDSLSMQERTRLIDRVLALGGIERVQPELDYLNRPANVGFEAMHRGLRKHAAEASRESTPEDETELRR